MPLPKQQRFTIAEIARRWDRSENYVEQLVRSRKFPCIIVVGELNFGSKLTRHLYFSRALWKKHYGEKTAVNSSAKHKDLEEQIARHEKEFKKRYGTSFDSTFLRESFQKDPGITFFKIGPNEVANLWNPSPPRTEWSWPEDSVKLYIPVSVVEDFEKRYGLLQREDKAKEPIPDVGAICPTKWYRTSDAARYLGVQLKHLQNCLIRQLSPKRKAGSRWQIQGQAILEHLKKYGLNS